MSISFSQLHFADPSLPARRLFWHVLSIGQVWRDEPERHAGLDKAGLFLFRVVSGAGDLEVNASRHRLGPGRTCWLVDLRQSRAYLPRGGKPLRTEGIRFGGPGLEGWFEELGEDPVFELPPGFLGPLLKRIQRLVRTRPVDCEWQVHSLLTSLWGALLTERGAMPAGRAPVPRAVGLVLDAVAADPARDWQARELAEIAAISYSRLRHHFRKTQGESLHGYLQRTRLDLARHLLSDPRKAVKEVANHLHFSSESAFSRAFQQGTGMSPTQFRERCRD
jgi:AraC-like DNA-binding protein